MIINVYNLYYINTLLMLLIIYLYICSVKIIVLPAYVLQCFPTICYS